MKDIYETIAMYRYTTLAITSIGYVINTPSHSVIRKCTIISVLLFMTIIMNYLYKINRNNKKRILYLVIIEGVGNGILIIPSGGIYSPYVWYVFNTMLSIGVELKKKYVHPILMIYILCIICSNFYYSSGIEASMIKSQYIFNTTVGISFASLIVQVIANYAKQIENQKNKLQYINQQLILASAKSEESLQWLMNTYEVINLCSIYNSTNEMIEMLLNYIVNVLHIPKVIFIENTSKLYSESVYSKGFEKKEQEEVYNLFISYYMKYKVEKNPLRAHFKLNDELLCLMIDCSYADFGCFILEIDEITDGLMFIKHIGDLVFKKYNLDKIENELIINKEQNRIANEIHDSVLQQLFGVGCSLFSLEKKAKDLTVDELVEEINYNRQIINTSMSELRKIIYGMSWNKKGTNKLLHKINNYIEEIQRLYGIKVTFDITGPLQSLDIKVQGVIYRIICEGISNSVRHGKATKIDVVVDINGEYIVISIVDNGNGFEIDTIERNESFGLGIKNIQVLVEELGGDFKINSRLNEGTKLKVDIPRIQYNRRKKE